MKIDAPQAGQRDHPARQNVAVRYHDHGIRTIFAQEGPAERCLQLMRLKDGKPGIQGCLLDRSDLHLVAPATGLVRIGDDQLDFEGRARQPFERRYGEFRSSTENQLHQSEWRSLRASPLTGFCLNLAYQPPALVRFRILSLMESRFSALRC